jgi:membrane peptidoglycan carboxypeptidase
VITSLDWELQELAETAVREGAERNQAGGAFNASLVAMDPRTGEVLSMVGSRDYFLDPLPEGCRPGINCKFEPHVNVAIRDRQPGSSFKPFVYATAFEKGYTDKTMLFDLFTEFNPLCSSGGTPRDRGAICYHPQNFDSKFRGPVTLRQALANSLNVPSVKTLYLAGVDDSIDTAQDMGITTLEDRERFGLALVLGGGEVKLLDMAASYSTFATEGMRHPVRPILRIEDKNGKVIEEFEPEEPVRVLDVEIARQVTDILSDNEARIPIFGPNNPLQFADREVAAKTGTTNEFRDGWTMGYTPSLAVGVWAGNNDNSSIRREPGSAIAAPIWREFLLGAFEKKQMPPEGFASPQPVEREKPVLNGQYRVNGDVHTILHYVDREDPLGPPPDSKDPLYDNWEASVRQWSGDRVDDEGGIIVITSPDSGDEVDESFSVAVRVNIPPEEIVSVEFYFGETLVATAEGGDDSFRTEISVPPGTTPGVYQVRARVFTAGVPDPYETSVSVQVGGGVREDDSRSNGED